MNQCQIKNIYYSPIHQEVNIQSSIGQHTQINLQKRGYQSVTHYMFNNIPQCINHKRRKGIYLTTFSDGQIIYFCERCYEMVQIQGFQCQKFQEFNRSQFMIGNNANPSSFQTKERKVELQTILGDIKKLHQSAHCSDIKFQALLKQEYKKASVKIQGLFQRLENQIQRLKLTSIEQMQQNYNRIAEFHKEIRCSMSWTRQQLQYLINKIKKSSQKLIMDKRFFQINIKLMHENLYEKSNKIRVGEESYQAYLQEFKVQNNVIADEIVKKIEKISQFVTFQNNISGIRNFSGEQVDEARTFQKIIEEMSTNHTLV